MSGNVALFLIFFLNFQLVHPGKYFANQLVHKQYLLVTDEQTNVKIFTEKLTTFNSASENLLF